jgi:hypothetical protein
LDRNPDKMSGPRAKPDDLNMEDVTRVHVKTDLFPLGWSFRDSCRAFVVFAVALFLGMALWWTSPWITGHDEPWDAACLHRPPPIL